MYRTNKGGSGVLDAIHQICPEIAAQAVQIEENRGLSRDLTEKMRKAGAFRMMIPKAKGGEELDLLQVLRVVEDVSRADASAGWTIMVANGFNALLPLFQPEAIDAVLGGTGDVLIRGALAPKGRLVQVEGGYRISGQWPMGSGSYEYKWVAAHGIVFDGDRPRIGPNGIPEMVMVVVPANEATFLDTWDSVGLRGSASHDFVLDDVFVPAGRTASMFGAANLDHPLFRLSFRILTGTQHSAVCTGAALGAMDDLAALAQSKRPAFRPDMRLIDDPVFRHRFGELAAHLDAICATAYWGAEEMMAFALSGEPVTPDDENRHNSMVAWVSRECCKIVDEVFALAGSDPCYRRSSIQRRWRDIRVGAQHTAASPDAYQGLGAALLNEAGAQPVAAAA